MSSGAKCVVVFVTCPSAAVATRLGTALVRRRLAACVNVVPGVHSIFWWKGRVERCREVLLLMKTTSRRFPGLRRAVIALHPYEVPEVLAMSIKAGHAAYLTWVREAVRGAQTSTPGRVS